MMNMTKMKRLVALVAVLCLLIACMVGCGKKGPEAQGDDGDKTAHVDYVEKTKFDLNSNTKKLEVTVHAYIDGDTTHFNVPHDVADNGVLKARYMGINTPESTGKIEEWC
jgi:predicted small lipoprotein YifL